jgi:predicted O-methyltransferase YrrM
VDTVTPYFLLKHPRLLARSPFGQVELTKAVIQYEVSSIKALWNSKNQGIEKVLSYCAGPNMYHKTGWLYVLCRQTRPHLVVETGVRAGASSSFILQAMTDNNEGVLYSIDLPNSSYEYVKDNLKQIHSDAMARGTVTGFAVPNELRKRWNLIIGDARLELPKLLSSCGEIDLFFHDSEHTYDHMMFEFSTVFDNIRRGGIISADDSDWNSSFVDFCTERGMKTFSVGGGSFAVKGIDEGDLDSTWGMNYR